MSHYIGIDLGTSAVKMLMTDENGEIIKSVSKEYPLYFPKEGWSEQNPSDWWSAVKNGLKELTANSDKSLVKGISFGGQMHGLVILDENDNVIRPAILWNDGRTQSEVDYLNNEVGKDKLSEYTANIAFAGFTAPKILWVKKNEPDNFKRISKIMLPKDYIAYMLTGVHSTDYSDASGMLLLDVKNKKWSKEMLDICGIDESVMPKLYESYEVMGTLKTEIAAELGLSGDTKVIAGAGDNAAAAIGTGTVKHGQCNISLGTSGTVFISQDTFSVDDNNALHSFAHADGKYHLMGCMLSAASCNKWWLEDILKTNDYTGSQNDIKELGENNVFFLPYLMGERSPHNDPNVRGAFIGMSILAYIWSIVPVFNFFFFLVVPIYPIVSEKEKISFKGLLSQKILYLLLIFMICSGASEIAMSQWASAFAESGLRVSKAVGDLAGPCAFALFMGTARAYYGQKADKIPLKKFMAACAVMCIACYLTASLLKNPIIALIGCALCGFSVGIFWPGTLSMAAQKIPGGGTAMYALMALAGDMGASSGPTVVGFVANASGGNLKYGLLAATVFPIIMLLGICKLKD